MGLATARAFAEAGAAVIIADINETTLGTAADDLTAVDHRVLGVRCDVSDEDSVVAISTVASTLGARIWPSSCFMHTHPRRLIALTLSKISAGSSAHHWVNLDASI